MSGIFGCASALWRRELLRFYRDKSRVIGGLFPPIIFWLFIGSGFSGSFRVGTGDGISYMQYFFPGILTLIFLFTAIFSTISIIEDRKEGFLQSVLVAPVPRVAIVLGKVAGSATLALIQGVPFIIIGLLAGIHPSISAIMEMILVLLTISFTFASIGFLIAWKLDSTQGFHAIMNMFLIPMWLLSGALFPVHNLPVWLEWMVKLNPLTYSMAALQQLLFDEGTIEGLPTFSFCIFEMLLFCAITFAIAVVVSRKGDNS